jgi:hypothetical protein
MECTAKDLDEIIGCPDKNCPFHYTRFENLPYQNKREGIDEPNLD